jgi:hypothetical protein
MYVDHVSDEPLDIIRSNKCESQIGSLCTSRFRALWNAYERERARADKAERESASLRVSLSNALREPRESSAGKVCPKCGSPSKTFYFNRQCTIDSHDPWHSAAGETAREFAQSPEWIARIAKEGKLGWYALADAYAASERARADAAEREREVARRQLRELRVVFDTQTAEVESLRSELQRKQ